MCTPAERVLMIMHMIPTFDQLYLDAVRFTIHPATIMAPEFTLKKLCIIGGLQTWTTDRLPSEVFMEHVSDNNVVLEKRKYEAILYNRRQVGSCFGHITFTQNRWIPSGVSTGGVFHVKVFESYTPNTHGVPGSYVEYRRCFYFWYITVLHLGRFTCYPIDNHETLLTDPLVQPAHILTQRLF